MKVNNPVINAKTFREWVDSRKEFDWVQYGEMYKYYDGYWKIINSFGYKDSKIYGVYPFIKTLSIPQLMKLKRQLEELIKKYENK